MGDAAVKNWERSNKYLGDAVVKNW